MDGGGGGGGSVQVHMNVGVDDNTDTYPQLKVMEKCR